MKRLPVQKSYHPDAEDACDQGLLVQVVYVLRERDDLLPAVALRHRPPGRCSLSPLRLPSSSFLPERGGWGAAARKVSFSAARKL